MATQNITTQPPAVDEDLRKLDRLVGTWRAADEVDGEMTFSWLPGGFFLKQEVDLVHLDERHTGIEIIGRERAFDAETASDDIKSRYYDSTGYTLDYVYEIDGDALTIWFGEKGSDVYFLGTFREDDNVLDGNWVWPGGGYHTVVTRVS